MDKFATWINHGFKNADGSERDHCCGCWIIVAEDAQDLRAVCNECGEERDLAPLLDGTN